MRKRSPEHRRAEVRGSAAEGSPEAIVRPYRPHALGKWQVAFIPAGRIAAPNPGFFCGDFPRKLRGSSAEAPRKRAPLAQARARARSPSGTVGGTGGTARARLLRTLHGGIAASRRRAPRPHSGFATTPTRNRRDAAPIALITRALVDAFVEARAAEARGSLAEGLAEAGTGRPRGFPLGFRKPPYKVEYYVTGINNNL